MDAAIAQNPAPPTSPGRFIDSMYGNGAVIDDGLSVCVHIDGVKWWAERGRDRDLLWRSCGGSGPVMQVLQSQDGDQFAWEASFQISANIWVKAGGINATAKEACQAAAACDGLPRTIYRYLDTETAWYATSQHHWLAALNNDEACIAKLGERFIWTRQWAAGEIALALTSSINGAGRLQGEANTLEDAMRAAIDAPEQFKRACAALIATLTAAPAAAPGI